MVGMQEFTRAIARFRLTQQPVLKLRSSDGLQAEFNLHLLRFGIQVDLIRKRLKLIAKQIRGSHQRLNPKLA